MTLSTLTLNWSLPYSDASWPAPVAYRVWRRANPEGAFELVGETTGLTYTDVAPGEEIYEYEVTSVW